MTTEKTDGRHEVRTRDAATAALRRLGVNNRDYNLFITTLGPNCYSVNMKLAREHVSGVKVLVNGRLQEQTTPTKVAVAKKPVVAIDFIHKVKEKAPRRESISSFAEKLILDGKTNDEVWKELQAKFNLDVTKKSYPTWYRCRLRRLGKLK